MKCFVNLNANMTGIFLGNEFYSMNIMAVIIGHCLIKDEVLLTVGCTSFPIYS